MTLIAEKRVGNVVPIVARTRRSTAGTTAGQLVANNGVTFTILAPDGTTTVNAAEPSAVLADGEVLYRWNTDNLSPGNYKVVVTAKDGANNEYDSTPSIVRLWS